MKPRVFSEFFKSLHFLAKIRYEIVLIQGLGLISQFIGAQIRKIFSFNEYSCSIEGVSFTRKCLIIRNKWTLSPLKLSFEDAMNDYAVVSNLSPLHASWVGYFYGIYRLEYLKSGREKKTDRFYYDDTNHDGFKVVSQDRVGNINYRLPGSDRLVCMSPSEILSSPHIINNFYSKDACYIGMIFAIKSTNLQRKNFYIKNARCSLRVIK